MEPKSDSPIDQDLDRLEYEIRRLKVEYDIYFNGGTMRPPIDTKGRVETVNQTHLRHAWDVIRTAISLQQSGGALQRDARTVAAAHSGTRRERPASHSRSSHGAYAST